MNKLRYYKIVKKYRLGGRKCDSGQLKMLDDVDERFVLQCMDNKSAAHERRHDIVMGRGRRIGKSDFLKFSIFSKTRRNLKNSLDLLQLLITEVDLEISDQYRQHVT